MYKRSTPDLAVRHEGKLETQNAPHWLANLPNSANSTSSSRTKYESYSLLNPRIIKEKFKFRLVLGPRGLVRHTC
jgi:hypothetical protein